MKDKVMDAMKKTFNPEFLNRVEESIVFHTLSKEEIGQIVDLLFKQVNERLQEKNLEAHLTSQAKELLIEHGYDPTFGARPLRRSIQKYIEDPFANELLKGNFALGGKIIIDRAEDKLVFYEDKGEKEELNGAIIQGKLDVGGVESEDDESPEPAEPVEDQDGHSEVESEADQKE